MRKGISIIQPIDMTFGEYAEGFFGDPARTRLVARMRAEDRAAAEAGRRPPNGERKTAALEKGNDPRGFLRRCRMFRQGCSAGYLIGMASVLSRHLIPALGPVPLRGITVSMVEKAAMDSGCGGSRRNRIIACASAVLSQAVRDGLADSDAAASAERFSEEPEEKRLLSPEEMARLFPGDDDALVSLWGSLMWAVFFLIARDTGWRMSEIAALRPCDYDAGRQGISTSRSADGVTGMAKDSIKTTRRGARFKVGLLSSRTARLLEALIAGNGGGQLFMAPRGGGLVRTSTTGARFRAALRKAGIDGEGRPEYVLRHQFDTEALWRMSDSARLLLLGHSKDRAEYLHPTPQDALDMLRRTIPKD